MNTVAQPGDRIDSCSIASAIFHSRNPFDIRSMEQNMTNLKGWAFERSRASTAHERGATSPAPPCDFGCMVSLYMTTHPIWRNGKAAMKSQSIDLFHCNMANQWNERASMMRILSNVSNIANKVTRYRPGELQ